MIFRRELYASVSFASAWCYLICVELELPSEQAMLITLFSGFLFRADQVAPVSYTHLWP